MKKQASSLLVLELVQVDVIELLLLLICCSSAEPAKLLTRQRVAGLGASLDRCTYVSFTHLVCRLQVCVLVSLHCLMLSVVRLRQNWPCSLPSCWDWMRTMMSLVAMDMADIG